MVIVGAGSAGAAAAALLARRGANVVCLDRRERTLAGARWINGVPGWAFDEAGLARPDARERVGDGGRFVLVAGWGPKHVVAEPDDVLDIDMRALVARLQAEAIACGAKIVGGVRASRVERGVLWTSAGTIAARWFVDASGAAGARLLDQRHEPADLCAAAQELRAITDVRRARSFFDAHGARPGDTLCFTGVAGGYSIVSARLVDAGVSLLTGSLPEHGHPSGASLLARFVAEHAWIGERLFGGARVIPLAAPSAPLAAGSIALLGDAAGQVFPAHGSGVGVGLVAARLLADAIASGAGPRGYAAAYRRRFGLLHSAYGALRRVSARLSPRDLEEMIDARLIDARTVRAALEQRWPPASLARALPSLAAAMSRPRLLYRVLFAPRALPSPR